MSNPATPRALPRSRRNQVLVVVGARGPPRPGVVPSWPELLRRPWFWLGVLTWPAAAWWWFG